MKPLNLPLLVSSEAITYAGGRVFRLFWVGFGAVVIVVIFVAALGLLAV